MRISSDHPPASRVVAASQRPSQFAFSLSPPGSTSASYRAPPGLTANTYPDRPSWKVSIATFTWSSFRSEASRALVKETMPAGSGSSQRTPMTRAFRSASTRTVVRPVGAAPGVGSLIVRVSIAGACCHASSSSVPSRRSDSTSVPAATEGRSAEAAGGPTAPGSGNGVCADAPAHTASVRAATNAQIGRLKAHAHGLRLCYNCGASPHGETRR